MPDTATTIDYTGLRRFHNALRILVNIDQPEFAAATGHYGVAMWTAFRNDPYRWFITAEDAAARGLWAIIESRQPRTTKDA